MKKNYGLVNVYLSTLFFISLFAISGCSSFNVIVHSNEKDISVNAEIADTNRERITGLMFRKELCDNCGMVFVFDDSNYRSFWMKNMLIPLDILFIDENIAIVDINYAFPCITENCDVYTSSSKAKYVLEVNEGFTKENNIDVGDKITLK